jgi:hypothetical protein
LQTFSADPASCREGAPKASGVQAAAIQIFVFNSSQASYEISPSKANRLWRASIQFTDIAAGGLPQPKQDEPRMTRIFTDTKKASFEVAPVRAADRDASCSFFIRFIRFIRGIRGFRFACEDFRQWHTASICRDPERRLC